MYLKDASGRANKTKKGIVQMYTANVQQIGRTFKDKWEKECKEVGTRANNNITLNKCTNPIKCTEPNNKVHKTNKTQTYNRHIKLTKMHISKPDKWYLYVTFINISTRWYQLYSNYFVLNILSYLDNVPARLWNTIQLHYDPDYPILMFYKKNPDIGQSQTQDLFDWEADIISPSFVLAILYSNVNYSNMQ